MSDYNFSRIYLNKNGTYTDINGNVIAKKGQALSGSAWRELANKYGTNYANHFSFNTRNGNIFQNGKWRLNNDATQRNDKATGLVRNNGSLMQKNPFTGKLEYIDWGAQKKNTWKPKQATKQAENQNNTEEQNSSIGTSIANALGIKGLAGDAAGTAAYFIPYVGNAFAAVDAVNDLRHGNYGSAAMNAVFAIPMIGNAAKLLKVGLKAGKMVNAANKVDKAANVVGKFDKWANRGLWATQAYQIPKGVTEAKNDYNKIVIAKKAAQDQTKDFNELKNLGYSDDQIRKMVGDDVFDSYKLLTARDNSFLGNMGTIYDLAKNEISSKN